MDSRTLRQIFTLANAFKEGDLAVGGTRDDRVREEARRALGAVTVGEIRRAKGVRRIGVRRGNWLSPEQQPSCEKRRGRYLIQIGRVGAR